MSRTIRFEATLPWPLHLVSRGIRDLVWTFPRRLGEPPTPGRLDVDLDVPLGSSGKVSHRAIVQLGANEPGSDAWRVPVEISMGRSYPTFRGHFEARDSLGDTELTLVGDYRLPLGIAGRVSGAAGGDGLARGSLRRFFESAVRAIKTDLQATAPAWHPPVRPDSLRDA